MNTKAHKFIENNRFEMSIMDMSRELDVGLGKLRNYMKDNNLMVSKKDSYKIRAKSNAQNNINMDYRRELKMRIKEAKTELTAITHKIKSNIKKSEPIDELINRRNNITVNIKTIQSRLENIGKEAYLPFTYHIKEK